MIIHIVNLVWYKTSVKQLKPSHYSADIAYRLGSISQNNPAMQRKEYLLSIETYRKFKQHHPA